MKVRRKRIVKSVTKATVIGNVTNWDKLKERIKDGIDQDNKAIKSALKEKEYEMASRLNVERTTLYYVLDVMMKELENAK